MFWASRHNVFEIHITREDYIIILGNSINSCGSRNFRTVGVVENLGSGNCFAAIYIPFFFSENKDLNKYCKHSLNIINVALLYACYVVNFLKNTTPQEKNSKHGVIEVGEEVLSYNHLRHCARISNSAAKIFNFL